MASVVNQLPASPPTENRRMSIPWVAIAWGEERISSGLASILNSTTPLWAAVLIFWVIPTERPSLLNRAEGGRFDAEVSAPSIRPRLQHRGECRDG